MQILWIAKTSPSSTGQLLLDVLLSALPSLLAVMRSKIKRTRNVIRTMRITNHSEQRSEMKLTRNLFSNLSQRWRWIVKHVRRSSDVKISAWEILWMELYYNISLQDYERYFVWFANLFMTLFITSVIIQCWVLTPYSELLYSEDEYIYLG